MYFSVFSGCFQFGGNEAALEHTVLNAMLHCSGVTSQPCLPQLVKIALVALIYRYTVQETAANDPNFGQLYMLYIRL